MSEPKKYFIPGPSFNRLERAPLDSMHLHEEKGRMRERTRIIGILQAEIAKFPYGDSEEGWPVYNLENVLRAITEEQ